MSAELWNTPEKLKYLRDRGLSDDTILDNFLGYSPGGRFKDCISIPYFDARGELVTVRYRHLREGADRKYDTERGYGRHLYNVKNTDCDVVGICEGEFDSLIMGQLGVPSVAVPGTGGWNRSWRWLFRNCNLVYVLVDHAEESNVDALKAEQKLRQKITAQVSMVTEVVLIDLPVGKDVTDMYLSQPRALKELL